MLIDATHPEETRVVVLRGHRVEEFDFESANRRQLRGNIYLAKVTRVEPSLQAAFVDYGGNRHGFLAFGEIHPDYYQIPIADRQALIAEEERAQRAADDEADHRAGRRNGPRERGSHRRREAVRSDPIESEADATAATSEQMAPEPGAAEGTVPDAGAPLELSTETPSPEPADAASPTTPVAETQIGRTQLETSTAAEPMPSGANDAVADDIRSEHASAAEEGHDDHETNETNDPTGDDGNIVEVNGHGAEGDEEMVESVGGSDAMEEVPERSPRGRRQYKIQEVIKRRQVMLVQVVKEERGTKGAALTTYLSLAGRYSVLMPNTARGGGISRKITSADDRRRLKEIAQELEVPEGMGVILRTAGAARTKTEVKRDFEYLLRLWETVRDLTLKSTAPTLVYEEGSLVKRSIRDLYNKDIDEILVAGEQAHTEAKDFMRMLMPSHAKNVKAYRDTLPIFTRHGIESQLDAMFTPVVQLRSGGYIVLNQTEALVAIDVNSGRATREHHIEDTALKTNVEAAEEVARQLRLRDLAGLVVIDFIDMDEKRNNRAVERRLKECLRHDRARIQVGHISHFGLLEMSRQRIRSSVLESSTEKCPHCGGSGHVRSVSSVALQLLRSLEELLLKGATHNLTIRTRTEIALYLLNQKRAHLRAIEERFRITIMVSADASIGGQVPFLIEKNEQVHSPEQAKAIAAQPSNLVPIEEEEEEEEAEEAPEQAAEETEETFESDEDAVAEVAGSEGEPSQEQDQARKRRRRRRGRRGGEGREAAPSDRDHAQLAHEADPTAAPGEPDETGEAPYDHAAGPASAGETDAESERRRRRRGRRGGRRNRREREDGQVPENGQVLENGGVPEPELARAVADFDGGPAMSSEPRAIPINERLNDTHPNPDEPRAAPGQWASRPQPIAFSEPARAAEAPAAEAPAPEPPAAEPTRRRSTVREPAPLHAEDAAPAPTFTPPPPAAEPVLSSLTESESRPRRSGWWSKRVLGKD
jgi:ribonuclease E